MPPYLSTTRLGEELDPTTGLRGEEDPLTTLALGEEEPVYTTHAVGEEDGSTMPVGEEDILTPTTSRSGEEELVAEPGFGDPFGAF